jgi:hypothetical protein
MYTTKGFEICRQPLEKKDNKKVSACKSRIRISALAFLRYHLLIFSVHVADGFWNYLESQAAFGKTFRVTGG